MQTPATSSPTTTTTTFSAPRGFAVGGLLAALMLVSVTLAQDASEGPTFRDAQAIAAVGRYGAAVDRLKTERQAAYALADRQYLAADAGTRADLVRVLQERQAAAVKAGLLDEAVALRDAAAQYARATPAAGGEGGGDAPPDANRPTTPTDLNALLAGSTWRVVAPGGFDSELQLMPDHTLRMGGKELDGMWAAVAANEVKLMPWAARKIVTWTLAPDGRSMGAGDIQATFVSRTPNPESRNGDQAP